MTPSRIASARRDAGMTQEMLAERIGVSVDTIRRAEQGKHQTQIITMIRISRTLGVPLAALVPEDVAATEAV